MKLAICLGLDGGKGNLGRLRLTTSDDDDDDDDDDFDFDFVTSIDTLELFCVFGFFVADCTNGKPPVKITTGPYQACGLWKWSKDYQERETWGPETYGTAKGVPKVHEMIRITPPKK